MKIKSETLRNVKIPGKTEVQGSLSRSCVSLRDSGGLRCGSEQSR